MKQIVEHMMAKGDAQPYNNCAADQKQVHIVEPRATGSSYCLVSKSTFDSSPAC
jgi:hypothetical protein